MDLHRPRKVRHPHHPQAADPGPARTEGDGQAFPSLRGIEPRPLRAPGLPRCRRPVERQTKGASAGAEGTRVPRVDPARLSRPATPDASFFHGKNAGRLVVVGPINLPVGRLFVEEVITECRKRGASRVDVLAFEFEMGLFPAVLDEAKGKGIDLAPKYIPAEVFDKRAVDKGQVVFHDVSFVEATSRYDQQEKRTLRIELTDFSVYHTQGVAGAVAASLKNGKSQVVCEQGQLIKVSKDKDGIVTREKLTRHWTDWVDYWAVDFDYMSRKEIIKVPTHSGLDVRCAPRTAHDAQRRLWCAQRTLPMSSRWTSRSVGPVATSSKTNGRASAPVRTAS